MGNIQQKLKKRLCGTAVPVGALRGSGGMGVGEFADLPDFARLCKKMGLGLIQILPVNDTGFESSPYSSLSAFALHPLYISIENLPEYAGVPPETKEKFTHASRQFGGEARFSHYRILKAKLEILHDVFFANKAAIIKKAAPGGTLAQWIQENSWVKEYAVYRRLKEANGGKSWKEWEQYRSVSAADIDALWKDDQFNEDHLFWAWLQEALDDQFRRASQAVAEAGLLLEGDLPILINEDSHDVWAHGEMFVPELSAGAPPDMYSPDGQNWGFPIYNWEAQEKDNYAWWKKRLEVAERYYHAYRIDHVLGFFRIWACSRSDYSSVLGRYVPYTPVRTRDLAALGFDKGRIRWVSRPHIPTEELLNALRNNWGGRFTEGDIAAAAQKVFSKVLERIGSEELWLFKKKIQGEKDIDKLGLHPACRAYLFKAWQNRIFIEYEKGKFSPLWYYRDSRAYKSLGENEKQQLEALIEARRAKSEKTWASQGKKLLTVLRERPMLPCAEDLGAVPDCVPLVLAKLKILGLRVVRWFRRWELEGQPFVPFDQYPTLSVCTPAVHDSSTVREWWENEADQQQFAGFLGYPSLPRVYNPGTAKVILHKTASASSRFRVFQIQDLLHLSPNWYAADPALERINVPGTCNDFNWTYRLPATIEEISKDKDLINAVAELG